MNDDNGKKALYAFLQDSLQKKGWELDTETLAILERQILLTEAASDLSQETRQITIEQDSSGKVSASSFKLWNVAQISMHDLLEFMGKEFGILLFDETAKQMIYSLVMLIHEFYPKLRVTFSDQEAQVLFAIAQLQQKSFTTEDLFPIFTEAFTSSLSETQMEASLEVLVQHRVLERTAVKQYKIREKIKNLTRLS